MDFFKKENSYLICEVENSKQLIKSNIYRYLLGKGSEVISMKRKSLFEFEFEENISLKDINIGLSMQNISKILILKFKGLSYFLYFINQYLKRMTIFLRDDALKTIKFIYDSYSNKKSIFSFLKRLKKEIPRFLCNNFFDLIEAYYVVSKFYEYNINYLIIIDDPRWVRLIDGLDINKVLILRKELFKGIYTYQSDLKFSIFTKYFSKSLNDIDFFKRLVINKNKIIGFYNSICFLDGIFFKDSCEIPFWTNYNHIIFDSVNKKEYYEANTNLVFENYSIKSFDYKENQKNTNIFINKEIQSKEIIINMLKYYKDREVNSLNGYKKEISFLARELRFFKNLGYILKVCIHPKLILNKEVIQIWETNFKNFNLNFFNTIRDTKIENAKIFISQPSTLFLDCNKKTIKICLDIYNIDCCDEYKKIANIYTNSASNIKDLYIQNYH